MRLATRIAGIEGRWAAEFASLEWARDRIMGGGFAANDAAAA